ncbi:MAG: cob(I)yrinic acid a,c-diamide adenosyltransferase [Candidatus Niyogibacteria bacterium]|nr:cob(I)yrinic acid a,c-diamide adenosyltransferase [Candidatus Niyogibacteria bacterium]
MLIVITGDGKGKTTSALGQALRSCGDGRKVLMLQFIKGPWKSGEDARHVWPAGFELRKGGLGFVGILGDSLPREKHAEAARATLRQAQDELESGVWDMLILDEIHNAIELKLLSVADALPLVEYARERKLDLICTGRNAPPEFLETADIVSEIRDVKHIYEKGVKARKGLDY